VRLEAEFVRDTALAVSGLLNREMYGPSVKPYQPAGYYSELNFPKRVYQPDYSEEQFCRRSMPRPARNARRSARCRTRRCNH
jgi:hypothetical protein